MYHNYQTKARKQLFPNSQCLEVNPNQRMIFCTSGDCAEEWNELGMEPRLQHHQVAEKCNKLGKAPRLQPHLVAVWGSMDLLPRLVLWLLCDEWQLTVRGLWDWFPGSSLLSECFTLHCSKNDWLNHQLILFAILSFFVKLHQCVKL